MKVHPTPRKRCESRAVTCHGQKKLRRLPHIFSKVLELPFKSDADVYVEESEDCFKFTVGDTDVDPDVRMVMTRIHPGVTKIGVGFGSGLDFGTSEFGLDLWRFRLPGSTRPDLASVSYIGGDLVVVVPKGDDGVDRISWDEGNTHLLLVQ